MQPQFVSIEPKKLLGICLEMSLVENRTGELWRSFMPRLKEIEPRVGNNLYSLQVYDENYFQQFDPTREFEKWALAEVKNFSVIPDEMEPFELPGGLYAVFQHKGMGTEIFQHIFSEWLPNSGYDLDNRPSEWKYSSYNAIIPSGPTLVLREEVLNWFDGLANFLYCHLRPLEI